LRWTGQQTERKARVIIKDGEWEAPTIIQGKVTLEVHLP
jgi:hypothetical protein